MSAGLPDWSCPTPEMLAAAQMARRCTERSGMNETRFADWVLSAKESLWYLQAMAWAKDPPSDFKMDEATRETFRKGMELVVKIVDLGYDQETRQWWYLRKIWPTDSEAAMGLLILMDTATMLERMKEIPIWPKEADRTSIVPGFLTVSAGFWVFFSLVCGPRWRQRFASIVRGMEEAKRIRMGRRRR